MRESPLVSNLRAGADPRRPRLLVLASTFPADVGDGTPAFVADLARVEATGFDTLVLVPQVPGGRAQQVRERYEVRRYRFFPRRWEDLADGAILENLRARPSRWLQLPTFFLAGALALRRAVRESRPDVIHVHWIIPQGLMALVAARRVPWLVTTLGGDLYALTSGPARFLKRQVLRRARAVTVMNEEMARVVVGLGVPEEKVHVLPMGVELGRIRPVDATAQRVPGRLVFVGRLVEKKGVAILLDALEALPADLDWSLDLIGDGPLRAELEARARQFGPRVTFHGQQGSTELGRMLAQAQVAVFPSVRAQSGDQDGLPVALLEAMAAGTPIVASDLPGLSDAVTGSSALVGAAADGPAGLLVEPGDAAALTAALGRLLGDGSLREGMGRAAVQRASAYSMDAIGARYVELLHGAVR
jgi:colanic acid/amylovoran biosynthesis glycosyltransferase